MDSVTIIQIVAGRIFVLFFVDLFPIPLGMIFEKAGFSPWLTLLWLIPILGPVAGGTMLRVVAFSDSKVVPAPQPAWAPPTFPPRA
ncbi:MAG: hypothetical protein ABSC48_00635 [Terracidiphilus sp.]|jgi:hypothetical protein